MSPDLIALIDNDTPKVNPLIGNGLATSEIKKSERYIDQVFKLVASSFPEGLVYLGYKRAIPIEEFRHKAKKRDSKFVYDIARSDVYLVHYLFRYFEKDILVPLFLPFCGDAGTLYISGSRHAISPVLKDRVISVGVNDVFVAVMYGKVNFYRASHSFILNGVVKHADVVWMRAYNKTEKQSKTRPVTKANSSIAHYLFCKYGFKETFRRFGNAEVIVGNDEINESNYPLDQYTICSSTRVKPVTAKSGFYEPTSLRIAIRNEEYTPLVQNLVTGFFYIVDHFPSRVTAEYVDHPRIWLILLGHILLSGNYSEGYLAQEMDVHIRSLDGYLDKPVEVSLHDIGIDVSNFFELMAVILKNFNTWIMDGADKVNSMYDKRITVLDDSLYELRAAIVKTHFQLQAMAKRTITEKEIESVFQRFLKAGKIFSITKDHREIAASSYPGDNKIFKFTSILIPQAELQKGGSRARTSTTDPTKKLHASIAEVGGYLNMPKVAPDGRNRVNSFIQIDPTGVIKRDPELVELIDHTQKLISGR